MAKQSRIEQIIDHLSKAEGDEGVASVHRWAAARLIWEEVSEGKSRRGLAAEIGKSHTHVRYMFNCWEMVGRKLELSDSSNLPSFQTIYMSDEIRGGEDEPGSGEHRKRSGKRGHPDDEMDYTTHGLVLQAANAIDALARNKAHWPLLTEDDLTILRAIPPTVRALLRDSTK